MSKYIYSIILKSDLCLSDGGVYNSSIDTDVCYDNYGFPYVPAKRLKGCLRECAIELVDWGENIEIKKVFGEGGESKNQSKVRIGNGYLKEYIELRKKIEKYHGSKIYHPQNILNNYTYLRTQTAIDYETGVADSTTLRTIRVVNRGLKFEFEVEFKDDKLKQQFDMCCRALRYMGISRTRGLGEIKIDCPNEKESDEKIAINHSMYEGSTIIDYEITTLEPVICKSINGGDGRSIDYLEGSKIFGLILENAKNKKDKEKFLDSIKDGNLICSNAYVSENNKRLTEVPAYIYSVKNNPDKYVNQLTVKENYAQENGLQLNMMKHCYVNIEEGGLYKKSVELEESYHHSRLDDKSIGRAIDDNDDASKFYQFSAIKQEQTFKGFIKGTKEQIKDIYNILSKKEDYYIGASRSSEYGKIRLVMTNISNSQTNDKIKTKSIVVKLNSPTICYNSKAMYTSDAKELIEEINSILCIKQEDIKANRKFIKYTSVGGFNTTWVAHKPTMTAFDKGSCILYEFHEEKEFEVNKHCFIGERNSEGFGETEVIAVDLEKKTESENIFFNDVTFESSSTINVKDDEFSKQICRRLFIDYIRQKASEETFSSKAKATVSNMLLMCKENDSFKAIQETCEERYGKKSEKKEEKLKFSESILNEVEKNSSKLLQDFSEEFSVEGYSENVDYIKMLYLENMLIQLKYKFRNTN